MSLLNQRHLFLSTLLYHQSQLFTSNPLKDRALTAKEIRILLTSHVASHDRVILANCVLLWPHWTKENLYAIDVSNCSGLTTLIESSSRLPPALSSEVGFIVAILGYYNAQVSNVLMQLFLRWLDVSIINNFHFKTTVIAMILSPHPPLPPPLLPSINLDPSLLISKLKDAVVELGLNLLPTKLSFTLLSFFLIHHLERTLPTLFVLLENETYKPLLWPLLIRLSSHQPHALAQLIVNRLSFFPASKLSSSPISTTLPALNSNSSSEKEEVSSFSPSVLQSISSSLLTPTTSSSSSTSTVNKKKPTLTTNATTPMTPTLTIFEIKKWRQVHFSGVPFKPSVASCSFNPTSTTLHLLQWLLFLLSPKAATTLMQSAASIPNISLPYYTPPDPAAISMLSESVLPTLGPIFSVLIYEHKSCLALIRGILEVIPCKHLDWWISLHLDFSSYLSTTKLVCEWTQQLILILRSLVSPTTLSTHSSSSSPSFSSSSMVSVKALNVLVSNETSPLWNFRIKFPNSDAVLDELDTSIKLCFNLGTKMQVTLDSSILINHLRQVLFGSSQETLPPIHSIPNYVNRLLNLVPYGRHQTDEHALSFLDFLIQEATLQRNSKALHFLLQWLDRWECTLVTTPVMVQWVTTPHISIQIRRAFLKALERHPTFLTLTHVTELSDSILRSLASVTLKQSLGWMLDAMLENKKTVPGPFEFPTSVVDAILIHITYPEPLASLYLSVSSKLPSVMTQSPTLQAFQRQVVQTPHTGMFRQSHFQTFVQTKKEVTVSQLRHVFHQTSPFPLPTVLWSSHEALMYYVAFELARYCILTRLKTPLGSSSQTLHGLEKWLMHSQSILVALTFSFFEKWVHAAFFQYSPNGHAGIPNTSLAPTSGSSSSSTMVATTNATATITTNTTNTTSTATTTLTNTSFSSSSSSSSCFWTWASVPKSSCVYFTANKKGILNWFQKLKKQVSHCCQTHGYLGEVFWQHTTNTLHVGSLVWLGWEDCLLHAGYRGLANGRVEGARLHLPLHDQALAYILLSDYASLESFITPWKTHSNELSKLQQFCWDVIHPSENSSISPTTAPVEPIFFTTALAATRAALVEGRLTRVVTHYSSAIPKVWIPYRFLDQMKLNVSGISTPLKLVRLQRKLKNFALARALLRIYPDLPNIERLKLDLAEGVVVGLDRLQPYPKFLAKLLLLESTSTAKPYVPSISFICSKPTYNWIYHTFLSKVPLNFIHAWFPKTFTVSPTAAALLYTLHRHSDDAKAWRLFALHFIDLLSSEDISLFGNKALRTMIKYLELEKRAHSKSRSMALQLLHWVPKLVHVTSLVSCQYTSTDHWVPWVPQLVTLFKSSISEVSKWSTEILTQLAKAHPSTCIYPILVACKDDHPAILDTFSSSSLVTSTRVFIQHALKITVLWEEIWFHELLHLQSQVYKKQCSLETMVSHLQFLKKSCLDCPSTPHETWFRNAFEPSLEDAFRKLDACVGSSADGLSLKRAWQPFRALIQQLSPLVNKARSLSLYDLDLFLDLELSNVYLPGTSETFLQVFPDVWVLPTKTKPKKMVFLSQSGQQHTYLVKGREDLHLDQLMMQFIQLINTVLPTTLPPAHVYAVVPLGPTAGIIQWIDAISIYALYKRHHQHIYHQPPPKPAYAFNVQAQRLFHFKSPPSSTSYHLSLRDACSLDQLIAIYKALCVEATDQLLKQEWLSQSLTSFEYFSKTRDFTHSVAMTSVLGYFMGLGDRHLDNILVDTHHHQLVHIDYAICFDRGANPQFLKVPEKVPFRLTRNLVTGMDVFYPTCFQQTMQTVMQCIQQHSQDVILIMENFLVQHDDGSDVMTMLSDPFLLPGMDGNETVGQDPVDDEDDTGNRFSADPQPQSKNNAQSLSSSLILTRLKQKLNGQTDGNNKLPINEVINLLITQAMDEANLASMYEGWLPWL